jgi:hypothetical protein
MEDIQADLYGEDSRLPYILTLCLDLCDRVGLSEKYERWLRLELNGYPDYQGFQDGFSDPEAFVAWMDSWASHRMIKTYVKILVPEYEGQRPTINDFSYGEIFVAHSLAGIARMIREADQSPAQELSVPFRKASPEHYAEFMSFLKEQIPGLHVPSDLFLFYSGASLKEILDGVRDKVLSLLSEARQRTV